MNAVKVAWVGQTFALAKGNDSGGKKSRIRRSKEERKAMVESFIKKYQNSNNGSFPSLNLTHKEVGGSFYTVREIVRDIIQENKVLGPAKFITDEQNNDRFYEQYPLGSISTEPQGHLSLSSNETHFVSDDHQNVSEELVSTSSDQFTGQQRQRFDNGRCINGILVEEESKETEAIKSSVHVNEEMLHTDVRTSPQLEGVENIVGASTSKVTHIATDVIVETFPIQATTKLTQGMDGMSGDDLTGTLEEESEKVEVASDSCKTGDRLDSLEKLPLGAMDEKSVANQVISSTMECTDLQIDVSRDDGLTLQASDQNQLVAGTESVLTSNNAHYKNTNDNNMSSTCEELLSQGAVVIESKAQNTLSTEEGRNSTLNRPKLESWKGASKKPADAETNPVLAVLKAFVDAFMKFWTE